MATEGSESVRDEQSSEVTQNESPSRKSSPPVHEETTTHLRFLLSNTEAGSVIGKGGSTINDIQSQSGSRIQLSRNYEYFPGTIDRIISLSGTVDSILKAVDLILSKLLDEFYAEDERQDDPVSKIRLIAPNSSCGGIIGKGGSTIRSLIEDSRTDIKISPQDAYFPGLHDRLVTVTGTLGEQLRAIELILLKLVNDQYYQQSGNSPFPYAALMHNGMNYGPNGFGGKYPSNRLPDKEERNSSVTIGVPDEHVGLVVGRGGRSILEISQLSGARIKISDRGDFMTGTSNRKVTITGSQKAIRVAESMIFRKVGTVDTQSWHLDLRYDQWVALPVSGQRPAARYKHAATAFDDKFYIMGGSHNGRFLSDFQVFDLKILTWNTIKLNVKNHSESKDGVLKEVFPATSGHSMIKWGTKLLLVAGFTKIITDKLTVRYIDLELHTCGTIETTGDVPVARSGQSVTLSGSKLIMFGGEDWKRRLLNDVHVLDLDTMTWKSVETIQTPPTPRFDHTAALHAGRYLFIFGGCSHSIFFSDLHLLDLETMEWSQPQTQGHMVSPRAGHTAVTIEGNWYIVGGGDNKSGALETLLIDMSKLVVSVLTNVKERDPLASEGVSISSASLGGENILVAFGGYNGRYHNEVFVMKLKPRISLNPKILQSPAAAAAAASVTAAYALAKAEILDLSMKEYSNPEETSVDLSVEINSIRKENKALESSLFEVTAENSALKTNIEETIENHAELSKELHSLQGQLIAERSRCAKLEAQIGELRKILESMPSLEEEVQSLRAQKLSFERYMELATTVQSQPSGGIWKWVTG